MQNASIAVSCSGSSSTAHKTHLIGPQAITPLFAINKSPPRVYGTVEEVVWKAAARTAEMHLAQQQKDYEKTRRVGLGLTQA